MKARARLGARSARPATLIYGFAHYGKSLFWYGSELLFAFFLTEVGGIAADRMGFVIAAGLLVSAGIDVAVGSRLSRVLPSAARAGRVQLVGAASSAASMLLMFACYWLPVQVRLPAALGVSLVFRVSYALFDIPQNSLMSLATDTVKARTNLASVRYIFSGLASLTVATWLPRLLQPGTADDRALRFCVMALAFSAVAIVSAAMLARALKTDHSDNRLGNVLSKQSAALNDEIRLLLFLMFIISLAAPVFSKVEPYYAAFVLRDPLMGGGVVVAVSIGMIAAQPIWSLLARRLSRSTLIGTTAAGIALAATAFLFARACGSAALIVTALLFGAASGGVGMAMWAAYGDAVSQHAPRREAWAFGLFTAAAKVSLAVSGLSLGLLLARIDYRGADRGILLSVMVVPSIIAGGLALALLSWRHLRGASRAINSSLPEEGRLER